MIAGQSLLSSNDAGSKLYFRSVIYEKKKISTNINRDLNSGGRVDRGYHYFGCCVRKKEQGELQEFRRFR